MDILIRDAFIVNPGSELNGKRKNLLVRDGVIKTISDEVPNADKVVESKSLHVSPGWVDLNAYVGDPGFEYKEDLQSLVKAASAGGFSEVVTIPETRPVVQSKDVISYIKARTASSIVTVHPLAAVTLDLKGEELTEMIDLFEAGAIAFSDGDHSIWHSDVLLKALQYNQKFGGVVIQRPEDKFLSAYGQMNEGKVSTYSGLKGIPAISEEVIVSRDLKILEYAGGKLHFTLLSTPGAINQVKDAKKRGLKVTCDIPAYLLAFDDTLAGTFDTLYKVNPPLRSKKDQDFFKKALKEGIIDAVVSAHRPQEVESKNLEFDMAEFGMEGLETVFSLINQALAGDLEVIVDKLAIAPRKILSLDIPEIKEGETANLTVFDPSVNWKVSAKDIYSKSKNNPLIGTELKGRVVALFNKKQFFALQ